jgi:F-type H+-transporting ATPase subunit epsilon
MSQKLMNIKILLPFEVFAQETSVSRMVAETSAGSWGLWPQRLDCALALVPGILIYETSVQGEVYVAVDDGVLVKVGTEVLVSLRRAFAGKDLRLLREAVQQQFLSQTEEEKNMRSALTKMESGFISRLAGFHRA